MQKTGPTLTETLTAGEGRYAIVAARWHAEIMDALIAGARQTLGSRGADESQAEVLRVPGSFELPLACEQAALSGKYVAVIALGVVIQGETPHNEYINMAVANGLMQAGQKSGIPVLFGLLTCRTMEQALDRAGGKVGNKGEEAALAAIEMVNLLRSIKGN
ncbi:MAG: 6,7-dimethyl-8-ribityllumazine synthase [Planctomycetaceae bacterium]|nr:6,7-dimethyl-8-ribityllumazine synthase [Planctomycetaceae bacterium]